MATSARTIEAAPTGRRRRWWLAAATTGAMLTAPAVVSRAAELPADWLATSPADLPYASLIAAWEHEGPETLLPSRPSAVAPALAAGAGAPLRPTTAGTGDRATDAPTDADAADGDGTEQVGALPDGVAELARYEDVVVAAEGASVELVGFHEASTGDALELVVLQPAVSAHPAVAADAPDDDGPVVVLPSRARAGAPTSAIDLSMTPRTPVVAPISGEVEEVAEYALYGTTRDQLVRIRSTEDPSVVAFVHHVDGASVAVGDAVEAGVTPIAAEARQLPFESQVDRFTAAHRGDAAPHVHIELRRA